MNGAHDLIGSATAAEILGVSRRHFNRMVTKHRVEPALSMGEHTAARLFNRADIEALLEKDATAA